MKKIFFLPLFLLLILFPLLLFAQTKLVIESSSGDAISTSSIRGFIFSDNTLIISLDQPFDFVKLNPDIEIIDCNGCTILGPAVVQATEGSNISFKLSSKTQGVTFSMKVSPEGANFDGDTFTWSTGGVQPGSYFAVFQATANSLSSQLLAILNITSQSPPPPPPPTYYTLTVTANPTNGGIVSGGGNYSGGSYATISATANSGYTFSKWTGEGITNPNSSTTTVLMDKTKTVTANFVYSGGGGGGSGTLENPVVLNNPIPGFEGIMWGYNLNWSKEYTIPKGGTVYFSIDPYVIIGKEITRTLRFNVFNYNQTTNVSSELIIINKITGQQSTTTFSGSQAYKERRFSKDERYLIKCTENGTRNQPMSVWWEIRSY